MSGRDAMPVSAVKAPVRADLRRMFAGAGVTGLGTVAAVILHYLQGIVIGRWCGAEVVGLYFFCLVAMQLLANATRLGWGDAALRFLPLYGDRSDAAACKGFIWRGAQLTLFASLLGTGLVWAAAGEFAPKLLHHPASTLFMRGFAVCLPVFTLLTLVLRCMQGLGLVRSMVVIRDVMQPAIALVLVSAVAFSGSSTAWLVVAFGVSLAAGLAVAVVSLLRLRQDIAQAAARYETVAWLRFSLPVSFSDSSSYMYRSFDMLLLPVFLSPLAVGIYGAATRTALIVGLVFVAFNTVYATLIAHRCRAADSAELQELVRTVIRYCLLFAWPLALGILLLSETILRAWGEEFAEGRWCLAVLLAAQLVKVPSDAMAYLLLMSGRSGVEAGNTLLGLILALALGFLMIPVWGLAGAAGALLSVKAAMLLLRYAQVVRLLGISPLGRVHVPTSAAAAVAGLAGWTARQVALTALPMWAAELTAVAVGVILVYPLLLLLRGFGREDWELIRHLVTGGRSSPRLEAACDE